MPAENFWLLGGLLVGMILWVRSGPQARALAAQRRERRREQRQRAVADERSRQWAAAHFRSIDRLRDASLPDLADGMTDRAREQGLEDPR